MDYSPPFFFDDFLAALFFAALFFAADALLLLAPLLAAAFLAAGFLVALFFAVLLAFDFESAFIGVSSPRSAASAASRRARSAPFDVVRLAGAGLRAERVAVSLSAIGSSVCPIAPPSITTTSDQRT